MSASVNIDDLKKAVDENVAPANESASNRIRYVLGPTSKRLILDRRHNTINPNEGANLANITDQREVNFYLSGNVYVDTHTVILRGRIKLDAPTPAAAFANSGRNAYTIDPYAGAFALVDRFNLKTLDGQDIETIEQVGMLARVLHTGSCPQDYLSSAGQIWLGDTQHKLNNKPFYVSPNAENLAENALHLPDATQQITAIERVRAYENKAMNEINHDHWRDWDSGKWISTGRFKDFEIPLFHVMGIFKQTRYIPLGALQRLQLQVRFARPQDTFTQVKSAFASTGGQNAAADLAAPLPTVPSYAIEGLCLDYQTVRLHELLDLKIREKINQPGPEGGLRIDFQSYAYSGQAINAATAAVQVTKGCADALSCFTVLQRASSRQSGGTVSFDPRSTAAASEKYYGAQFHTTGIHAGAPFETCTGTAPAPIPANSHAVYDQQVAEYPCPRWYYQIGSEKIPENVVDGFPRSYRYLQEALGRFGDINLAPVSLENFSDRYFIMAANFENDEVSLSGMNYTGRTLYLGNSLTLQLDQLDVSIAAGGPLYAHAFLLYTKLLIIKANGQIRIQE